MQMGLLKKKKKDRDLTKTLHFMAFSAFWHLKSLLKPFLHDSQYWEHLQSVNHWSEAKVAFM